MKRVYIHPLPVRIWHWTNALGFIVLIASGLQIRYLEMAELIPFKWAVEIHNWVGFFLIANYFLWLGFYMFSDKITVYLPEMNAQKYFKDSWRQIKFYGYEIFLGKPNPHHPTAQHKFNPLQQMMYQIIMLLFVPILFLSGLLLWDVKRFAYWVDLFGGVRFVDTIHVVMFIVFSGFLVVHIYLVTLGPTRLAHIKAMFTGYEELKDGDKLSNPSEKE